jgi:hypothetical protein
VIVVDAIANKCGKEKEKEKKKKKRYKKEI